MNGAPQSLDPEELLAHASWVRTLAVALVGESRADDLAQQTMLRAMERPPRHRKNLRGWLGAVARNFAINATRTEKRRRELLGKREYEDKRDMAVAGGDSSLPPAPEELLGKSEAHTQVISALMDLKDPGRHLLMLRFFEDLSPSEIAARHDMKPSTVRVQLMRALDELRNLMKNRFGGDGMAPCIALLTSTLAPKVVATATVAGSGMLASTGTSLLVLGGILTAMAVGVYLWEQPETPSTDPLTGVVATAGSDESEHDSEPALVAVENGVPGTQRTAVPRLRLSVRDSVGEPLAATLIRLHRQGASLGFLSTDPDGLAQMPPMEGEAVLQLSALDHAPLLAKIDLAEGEHQFELPEGALISGCVAANEPLSPGIFLGLAADTPLYREETEEFSWLDRLDQRYASYQNFLVSVRPDGGFSFAGLPDGWTGTLSSYDPRYRLDDRGLDGLVDGHLRISAPARDLRLRLVAVPRISGRVLLAEGSEGCSLSVHLPGANTVRELGPDGAFEILQDPTQVTNLELVVHAADGQFGRFQFEQLPPDGQLGDLELHALPLAHVRVLNPDGVPVQGARIFDLHENGAGAITDTEGRARLILMEDQMQLLVRASGLQAQLIEMGSLSNSESRNETAANEDRAELQVTLQAANLLDLRFMGPDGEVAPAAAQNLEIRLEAAQGLFSGSHTLDRDFRPRTGDLYASGVSDRGITIAQFRPGADGSVQLHGVGVARQPLLTIKSVGGKLLWRELLPPMPAQGVLRHEVRLAELPRSFAGQVVDAQGRAVAGAKLALRNFDPQHPEAEARFVLANTNLQGRFQFPAIYSERVELQITAAGHARWAQADYTLPPQGQEPTLRMVPGRSLDLQVRQSDGRLVSRFTASAAGHSANNSALGVFHSQSNNQGQLRMTGLPVDDLELKIQVDGWSYLIEAPRGQSHIDFELPARGVLQVDFENLNSDLQQLGVVDPQTAEDAVIVLRLERGRQGIETILQGGVQRLTLPAGNWQATLLSAPGTQGAGQRILASRSFRLAAGLERDLRMN